MAKRQREWARRKRDELFGLLGAVCVDCGTTTKLTFDVIVPMGSAHHRYDWSKRMTFYVRQYRAGNLAVRCDQCNAKKGGYYD